MGDTWERGLWEACGRCRKRPPRLALAFPCLANGRLEIGTTMAVMEKFQASHSRRGAALRRHQDDHWLVIIGNTLFPFDLNLRPPHIDGTVLSGSVVLPEASSASAPCIVKRLRHLRDSYLGFSASYICNPVPCSNDQIDPDNSSAPASYRQPVRTEAQGRFQSPSGVNYWQKEGGAVVPPLKHGCSSTSIETATTLCLEVVLPA